MSERHPRRRTATMRLATVIALVAVLGAFPEQRAPALSAPGAPLVYSSRSGPATGEVSLRWRIPTPVATPVTSYAFSISLDAGTTWSAPSSLHSTALVASSATNAPLACPNTVPGSSGCQYRLYAMYASGLGPPSNTVSLWSAPNSPATSASTLFNRTTGVVRLNWAPATSSGGLPVWYEVIASTDGGAFQSASISYTTVTYIPCAGALTCAYRVLARNLEGPSPLGPVATVSLAPGAVTSPAAKVTGTDPGSGKSAIQISWSATETGMRPAGYEIEQCLILAGTRSGCEAASHFWGSPLPVALPASDPVVLTSSCRSGITTCAFRVRAHNVRGGLGSWRPFTVMPWAPFNVRVAPGRARNTVAVTFDGPAESGAGVNSAKHYRVLFCTNDCGRSTQWRASSWTVAYPPKGTSPFTAGTFSCTSRAARPMCHVRMQFVDGLDHPGPLTAVATGAPRS